MMRRPRGLKLGGPVGVEPARRPWRASRRPTAMMAAPPTHAPANKRSGASRYSRRAPRKRAAALRGRAPCRGTKAGPSPNSTAPGPGGDKRRSSRSPRRRPSTAVTDAQQPPPLLSPRQPQDGIKERSAQEQAEEQDLRAQRRRPPIEDGAPGRERPPQVEEGCGHRQHGDREYATMPSLLAPASLGAPGRRGRGAPRRGPSRRRAPRPG